MLVARAADYIELSKPRIAALVLVVVAVSAFVGSGGSVALVPLTNALLGTALVAASASACNQLLERRSDAMMPRTSDRPLPGGRLHSRQVVFYAIAALVVGLGWLALLVNFTTAVLGLLTWMIYVAAYTPLKSRSSANTAVGAVAGALPVLMGWSAAGASFSLTGGLVPGGVRVAALFLIVYLWQFPHFMAIAWIYRHEYSAARLRMLTVVDPTGRRAGAQAILGALALLPVSYLAAFGIAGSLYLICAIVLWAAYLAAACIFCWRRNSQSARTLLQASLVYLPALLILLVVSPLV
jgi:heme o synthase